ncbi:MAG TPA: EF-Tu/IF-2/RF-3 family GTPase, partial [Acidimicrobiales bacterium]|nr:EF-Tu/IF-2/RF-3 family GTPase [Acidimicrobiales bacterium]
ELLDEVESQLQLVPTPVTWPVGSAESFVGLVDRRDSSFTRFARVARGAGEAGEEHLGLDAVGEHGGDGEAALEELDLLDAVGHDLDVEAFLGGVATPVFFGSALTNFGVRLLLDGVVDLAPSPRAREDVKGELRLLDDPFSAFVFKVQANMDPSHRDRIAFVRVCSGRFERGMVVTHQPTGKPFATKYAHAVFGQDRETIEEAYPGDVVGLVNATGVTVGDTLYVAPEVTYPGIPSFAPELFASIRCRDAGKFKQFRSGIKQLDEEGVVQVLRDPDLGEQVPMLAAVGQMQFEVAVHRLENEFGAPVELSTTNYKVARLTDESSAPTLRGMSGVRVLQRADGTQLALFESPFWLARVEAEQPELRLDRLVAEGLAG